MEKFKRFWTSFANNFGKCILKNNNSTKQQSLKHVLSSSCVGRTTIGKFSDVPVFKAINFESKVAFKSKYLYNIIAFYQSEKPTITKPFNRQIKNV